MDAKSGIQFLVVLLKDPNCPMDGTDLDEAVRIAAVKSPSAAFDAAQRYYVIRHGSAVMNGYLAFAKGTRWLAMIRRDEGQTALEATVQELRQGVPGAAAQPEEKEDETIRLIDQILAVVSDSARVQVQKAIALALERHAGQAREGGEPHANHVLRVGLAAAEWCHRQDPESILWGASRNMICTAILHDILEDTQTIEQELQDEFGHDVARMVKALSHVEEDEPDEVYLSRVAQGGWMTWRIKFYDRFDNIRSLALAPQDFRDRKIAEIEASLPIWRRFEPREFADGIEEAIADLRKEVGGA